MSPSTDPPSTSPGLCRVTPPRVQPQPTLDSVLPSLLHDLRSRVTALSSFTELLRQQVESSGDPRAKSLLDAVLANQELIVQALEGVALLRGTGSNAAPIAPLLSQVGTKLQKVLSRNGMTLNLSGETPDRDVEGRSFAAAVGHVLTASSRVLGRLSGSTMNVSVSTGPARANVTFVVSWVGAPDAVVADDLASSLTPEPGSFAGAVLSRALARLDGDLTVTPQGSGVVIALDVDAPERRS